MNLYSFYVHQVHNYIKIIKHTYDPMINNQEEEYATEWGFQVNLILGSGGDDLKMTVTNIVKQLE